MLLFNFRVWSFFKKTCICWTEYYIQVCFYFYWEYNDEETTYGSWNSRFRTPFMRVWDW